MMPYFILAYFISCLIFSGPRGQPPVQQDVLLLLPHHQGPGGQHGPPGRLSGQERQARGLREDVR